MTGRRLRRALEGVLLAAAPLALADCTIASSCSEGPSLPTARLLAVDASLASGGPLSAAQCDDVCNEFSTGVVTCVRQSAESVLCITHPLPCEGRRPVGLRRASARADSDFQRHLVEAAWLEAASVAAFRVLRAELRAHGAPRHLLRAASRSQRDERRHARASRALARRFGSSVPAVERSASPLRPLVAIALESAVEGCVRETWGALIALRQARRASELGVRSTLSRIARDEVRHAELAWQVDGWLSSRLSKAERRSVLGARAAALAELAREIRVTLPKAERDRLGLPGPAEATQMLAGLERELALV
ncbi:MAG: hypothetical protein QM756_33495 [Polyangiaceae bacterium]